MERIDPAKAAAVWQRVHTPTPPPADGEDLLRLIQEELTDGLTYLQLSKQIGGSQGNILRHMFQQDFSHTPCLKGIYRLITGNHPVVATPKIHPESVGATLRRCYGREMRCLVQYEARMSDPEYGKVFSRLALQEQEHCRQILEILGNLKGLK